MMRKNRDEVSPLKIFEGQHMKAHKTDETPTRLALLEQSTYHINESLQDIKKELKEFRKELNDRFDKVEDRFDKVDDKFGKVHERIDKLDQKFDHRFNRLEGRTFQVIFLICSSVIGYIFAKIYHFI